MRYNPFKHACFFIYIMWDVCWFVPFQACVYVLIQFTCQLNLCEAWLYMLWVIWNCNLVMVSWIGIWYGFEIVYNCHNICIHGDGIEFRGEKICMVNFITTWYATTRCTVMVVVLVRALSSMSSFARDCMEVMGHVTTPYICSLMRGAIVHARALYLWQGISQVWWAGDNLVNWICFCLDCVLAYGSCHEQTDK